MRGSLFAARTLAAASLLCFVGAAPARAPKAPPNAPVDALASVRALLHEPENKIDLETATLAIDRIIDPTMNTAAVKHELDAWADAVRKRLPAKPSTPDKMIALLSTLYDPGPWNGNRPFTYDLADPLGTDVRNKLLARYLATRKGNCTSMPILVAILSQKLGIQTTLATAPQHMLVKFRDDRGAWMDVEATSGYVVKDSFYPRKMHITPKALANGIYLRPLSAREDVGALLEPLMAAYLKNHRSQQVIAVADLALKVNPKDTSAMIYEADAYYDLFKERFADRYPNLKDIPLDERKEAIWMNRQNPYWASRAESLGWAPGTATGKQAYLDSVAREKARREAKK